MFVCVYVRVRGVYVRMCEIQSLGVDGVDIYVLTYTVTICRHVNIFAFDAPGAIRYSIGGGIENGCLEGYSTMEHSKTKK